jgi:hypothetical protein
MRWRGQGIGVEAFLLATQVRHRHRLRKKSTVTSVLQPIHFHRFFKEIASAKTTTH